MLTPEDTEDQYSPPVGAELVRVREELVEICKKHCGPETVRGAEQHLINAYWRWFLEES